MLNRLKHPVMCAVLTVSAALAAASEPLDFNYRIAGDSKVRPILVFNDGQDTYIQPNPETAADITVTGAVAEREGPYFVIRGLAGTFGVQLKKGPSATVAYKGSPKTARADQPARLAPATSVPTPEMRAAIPASAGVPVGQVPSQAPPVQTSCVPTKSRKDAAFVVYFPGNSTRMSPKSEAQLKGAVGDIDTLTAAEITAEGQAGKIAGERAAAMRQVLEAQGVSKTKITATTREATGIGSELRLVREITLPCANAGVTVSYRDAQHVSVAGAGDAKAIIVQVAKEARLELSIEGPETPLPIVLAETTKPLLAILEIIGNKLEDKADLIFRGNSAIVLRYRSQK